MSFLSYIKKWSLLFLPVSLFFACSDEISTADDEYTVFPDNDYFFSYAPNDYAANDSISANLTHGVKLMVHPKASYELSFKKDPSVSDVPELQLFHLYLNEDSTAYYGKKIRSLHPVENNGRYVYNFDCEEKDIAEWATSLSVDGEFYKGRTDSVRWIGRGSFSDHFSLNLIVVGEHTLTSDDVGAEELARKTLSAGIIRVSPSIRFTSAMRTNIPLLGISIRQTNRGWRVGRRRICSFMSWVAGLKMASGKRWISSMFIALNAT